MDSVKVEVEAKNGVDFNNEDLGKQLAGKIKDTIGLSMEIDLKSPNSIPRSQGGKLSRILDKRKL